MTGVTSLEVDGETGNRTFTVTTGQSVKLSNIVTASAVETVAGNTPTSLDVTLNRAGTAALTLAGTPVEVNFSGTALSTLNLTGSTADSSIVLNNSGAALTTVNVGGDKAVAIATKAGINTIKTVNASANSGGVTYDASAATADNQLTFTGGAGNDKVVFKAGYLTAGTTGDILDGGTGTDTLVINDTTPVYAAINAAKGFDVLGLNTTGATVDISQLTGINSFAVGSGNLSETFNNGKSTSTFAIDLTGGNTGTVTINNAVGETASTVTIDNQAGSAKTLAGLAFSGVSTISLVSSGKALGSNVLTDITNADNSNIKVSGALDFSLAGVDATTTGSKIDASAMTGKFSVVGSTKNDVILGGSAADTLQGAVKNTANQADTLTGGAGADKFVFLADTAQANLFASSAGTTAITKITDFVAGTDKIVLSYTTSALTSATVATAQTIATATDLTGVYAGITAIAASTATNASAVVVTVQAGAAAGTYLYVNDATGAVSNTADMLINITGVSGTITAADFLFA
jgi:hypothetical protein